MCSQWDNASHWEWCVATWHFEATNTRLSRSQTQSQSQGSEVRGMRGHRMTTALCWKELQGPQPGSLLAAGLTGELSLSKFIQSPRGLAHSVCTLHNHKQFMKIKNNLLIVKKQINTQTERRDSSTVAPSNEASRTSISPDKSRWVASSQEPGSDGWRVGVSLPGDENVLELGSGGWCSTLWKYWKPLKLYTLKGIPVVRTPRFHCRGYRFRPPGSELRSCKPCGVAKINN